MFVVLPESNGNMVGIGVSGTLRDADYGAFLPVLDDLIDEHGPLRVLLDLEEFKGWEPDAVMDDFAFGMRHWSDFERMAIVADRTWEDLVPLHMDKLLDAEVRRFPLAGRDMAWAWINA